MLTPLHRFNNDMVFVDGELLQSAGWEGELDAEVVLHRLRQPGYVYIGVDPKDRLVEITAFDVALLPREPRPAHGKPSTARAPMIRGADVHPVRLSRHRHRGQAAGGVRHGGADRRSDRPGRSRDATARKSTGTTLEHVTISFCSRVAGYFRGDGLTIRHSLVSDTSTEGIYVIGSSDVLLERNIIRRNNVEQLTGYYPAAVKIFNQSRRVTVRDNLVIDSPTRTASGTTSATWTASS